MREPVLEEGSDLGARAEGRVMVEVDVEEDRDLGPERGDRAVGLVAFDDEPARAGARVAAELRDLAADEEGRVETEPVETERDHSARRRLAVRAGDDDRAAERHELGEQIGARPSGRHGPRTPSRRRPPSRRAAAAARARSSPRRPRDARGTACRRGPSPRPPPPTHVREARTRSCPHRRSRRSRCAYR